MHLDGERAAGNGTAAPSPGDFIEAMERVGSGPAVLVVTVAAQLSASHAAARLASVEAGGARPVTVLDSGSASAGQGLVVLAAARAAWRGEPLAAVAASAGTARERVRLVAQIASLDRLARGGRVPAVAAAGARLTGMRPVFELTKGVVRPLRPAFSAASAEQRILAVLARDRPVDPRGCTSPPCTPATRRRHCACSSAPPGSPSPRSITSPSCLR